MVEWDCCQNHQSSYMALRSTARRFGSEVSWLFRLTRQETSPFGPCLTLRLHWQLVIRHSSGHAISLSCLTAGLSGKVMTLVACVFIWGSSRLSCIPNPTISVFFYNNREGPLQALLKPSLSISHVMASGDTCPQGTSNARHVATLAGLRTRPKDYTTTGQTTKLLRTTFLQPSPD
jgi:hypothetical protein